MYILRWYFRESFFMSWSFQKSNHVKGVLKALFYAHPLQKQSKLKVCILLRQILIKWGDHLT